LPISFAGVSGVLFGEWTYYIIRATVTSASKTRTHRHNLYQVFRKGDEGRYAHISSNPFTIWLGKISNDYLTSRGGRIPARTFRNLHLARDVLRLLRSLQAASLCRRPQRPVYFCGGAGTSPCWFITALIFSCPAAAGVDDGGHFTKELRPMSAGVTTASALALALSDCEAMHRAARMKSVSPQRCPPAGHYGEHQHAFQTVNGSS